MSKPLTSDQVLISNAIKAVDKAIARGEKYHWDDPNKCLAGHYACSLSADIYDFDPDLYHHLSTMACVVHETQKIKHRDWPKMRAALMKEFNLADSP